MTKIILNSNRGTQPAITTTPTFGGTIAVGETATATAGTVTGDGAPATTWQWLRDGAAISGATSPTYVMQAADEATSLSVRQIATSIYGTVTRESTTQVVAAGASGEVVINGAPTISGTVEVGQTLTASAAAVTGNTPITTTWQWRRDGVDISGATSVTYTLVEADDLTAISVEQTSSNNVPSSDTAVSASVTVGVAVIEPIFLGVQDDTASGSSGSGTFTYTGLSGDYDIIVATGPSDKALTLTVDGTNIPRILPVLDSSYPSAGGRLGVFKGTLTLNGSGTLTYALGMSAGDSTYPISAVLVKGGDLQPVSTSQNLKYTGQGENMAFPDIAAPANGAFLLGISCGRGAFFENVGGEIYPAWSYMSQQGVVTNSGTNEGMAVYWSEDQFAGYYSETAETGPGATDRIAHAFLVWTPKNAPTPPATVQAWTLENDAAVTGDVANLDVQAVPYLDGHVVDHYEVEIFKVGGTVVELLLGDPQPNYVRRIRVDQNATTECRIRPIYRNLTTLAMSNGTWSDTLSVTTTTGSPAIDLTPSLTTCFTGETIVLETANERGFDLITMDGTGKSLRRPMHELDYYIECTDAAESGNLTVLPADYQAVYPNISRHNCRNRMFAFSPQTAGTRTFSAEVRDLSGNLATDTVQVTVQDPLTTFAPGDIYAFSSTSDFTGIPGGANTYTVWSTFVAALLAIPSGDVLIMIHDDEVQGDHTQFTINAPDSVHIRNYGGGTNRPKLNWPFYAQVGRCSIHGIDFDGEYDPSDYPTGTSFRPLDGIDVSNCAHAGVSWCRTAGFNLNMYFPAPGNTLAIHDWLGTNWANFGLFGDSGGRLVIHGGYNVQNPDTIRAEVGNTKGETTAPVFADHGPFRISRPQTDYSVSRYMSFSINHWGGIGAAQPCFRLFGSGSTPRPIGVHITDTFTQGTGMAISDSSRASGNAYSSPQDVVVNGLLHVSVMGSGTVCTVRMGGTTIWNSLFVAPSNALNEASNNGVGQILGAQSEYEGNYPPYNNREQPIRFACCTFVNQSRDGDTNTDFFRLITVSSAVASGGKPWDSGHQDVEVLNEVTTAPFFTTPENTYEPINDTALGISGLYQQRVVWDGTQVVIDPAYGTPNEAFALFNVEVGSAGYQAATGDYVPYRDARGNVRGANPSKGWLEPI